MSVATEIRCTVEHATPADREALAEMYRSFEPKGASLGLPPRHVAETGTILRVVEKLKGAIGYTPEELAKTANVKVVARIRQGKVLPP